MTNTGVPSMRRLFSTANCVAVGVALALIVGCDGGSWKCVPVSGSLQVGGQPAEGAQVTLVPINLGTKSELPRPTAVVEADGSFKLLTYDPSSRKTYPGAPPGEYKVTVTWITPLHVGEKVDQKKRPTDKLGGKYLNPERSTMKVTVNDQPTELAPIRLK